MKILFCLISFTVFCEGALAARAHFTHRGDVSRSSVNSEEKVLNHKTVAKNFGKLFDLPVEGKVYAQPLYVPDVKLTDGSIRNVVYVATMGNMLYAFDADKAPTTAQPSIWQRDFKTKKPRPMHEDDEFEEIASFEGILSTPFIDLENKAIFVVSMEVLPKSGGAVYQLHKLDIVTGKLLQSVKVSGHLPGRGADAKIIDGESVIPFNANQHLQRPGLLLHKGYVHLAFGSLGDRDPFHGWIFSYRAKDLVGGASFITTPIGLTASPGAGIWQSGMGLTIDELGYVYIATGNGDFSEESQDWGNTILKLDFKPETAKFGVLDHFTPFDQKVLSDLDLDVGSAGILFIPPRFLVGAGKTGKFYVLNRDSLGGYRPDNSCDSGAIQVFQVTEPNWRKVVNNASMWNIHGAPVQWKGTVYVMGESDPVKAFEMNLQTGRFNETPISKSTFVAPVGMPGGFVSLSLDKDKPDDSGIVWAVHPFDGDATFEVRRGILHALDAKNLQTELCNSHQTENDDFGNFAKFVPPTVVAGKVYMATFSDKVAVYGVKQR